GGGGGGGWGGVGVGGSCHYGVGGLGGRWGHYGLGGVGRWLLLAVWTLRCLLKGTVRPRATIKAPASITRCHNSFGRPPPFERLVVLRTILACRSRTILPDISAPPADRLIT